MPIYEFRCQACNAKSSIFVRSIQNPISPTCPSCGSYNLVRIMSSFTSPRPYDARLEDPCHPSPDYDRDPRNIGRWAEKRLGDLGVDMYSEEYHNAFSEVRDMIEAAREGEMPETIKDIID